MPKNPTEVSPEGIKELIASEGVRYQVYDDANGKKVSSYSQIKGYPTIGVGHLIKKKERDFFSQFLVGRGKMSKNQVFRLFKKDLPKYTKPVLKRIKQPITQSMLDALVSLSYNTGNNSKSVKGAIAAINKKDYDGAAQAILNGPTHSKGRKLSGLVKRRKKEASMFLEEGKPGALLQRIFFWTGVTAGTIAAGLLGWGWISKKFLTSGSKYLNQPYKYYEEGFDVHIRGPKGKVTLPKANDNRMSMTERVLISDTDFKGLQDLTTSANYGNEEAINIFNSWGV